MTESSKEFQKMKDYSKNFVDDREWCKYHTPKNLAVGISVEAGELLERFQWKSDEELQKSLQDPDFLGGIKDEIGDILNLLIRMSTVLDIDLAKAFWDKILKNEEKYPVELSRGNTAKYSELSGSK